MTNKTCPDCGVLVDHGFHATDCPQLKETHQIEQSTSGRLLVREPRPHIGSFEVVDDIGKERKVK